jgi:hypothetical protein
MSTRSEILVAAQPVGPQLILAVCPARTPAARIPCATNCLGIFADGRVRRALVCWKHDAVEETIPRRPPFLQLLLQVHP